LNPAKCLPDFVAARLGSAYGKAYFLVHAKRTTGVFTAAGAGVKTNLLFFTKTNKPTERVWYYDLSDIKTGKTKPFLLTHMDDFFQRLPQRHTDAGTSERS
jgi:hypothetical protein